MAEDAVVARAHVAVAGVRQPALDLLDQAVTHHAEEIAYLSSYGNVHCWFGDLMIR
jgi:hypothetical protein